MQESKKINENDMNVLRFLSKYKMLKIEDASLIYKTKRYYRQKVNRLIEKDYVKRYKSYIIIGKNGRKILNKVGSDYIKNIKNESYMERLRHIAEIATLTINTNIDFIPSWNIKEKDVFTETARRYIGKLLIDNKEYLIYYISNKKEHVYIKQLLFDVNKAINYNNIIIFVDNYDVICEKYYNLSFGKDNTYIIINSKINKDIIKKYNEIDFHELLENIYNQEILISNWELADYVLEDGTYIINMPFINTEVIQKVNWFFIENSESNKKLEIVTLNDNIEKIKEILNSKCSIKAIDENLLGGANEIIKEDK